MKKDDASRALPFMAGLILFTALFAAASYLIAVVMTNYFSELSDGEKLIPVSAGGSLPLLIIDPGHGGEDGGSTSGEVLEKNINLAISEDVDAICKLIGMPSKMTRTTDTALYDLYGDLEEYAGKKKLYDLKNRVRFVREEGGDVYLGIHTNKFPEAKYRGLQVYYSPNAEESRAIAEAIQSASREYLMPENEREVKEATSAIYVLDRAEVPAVLVEVGFISNPDDLSLLCDPAYRLRCAAAIVSAVAKCGTGHGGY